MKVMEKITCTAPGECGPAPLQESRSVLQSAKRRLLVSAVISGIFLVIIGIFPGIYLSVTDDINILMTVSGQMTGYPYSGVPAYMNHVFTAMLCFLYTVFGSVPWYGVYHIATIWCSVTMFIYSYITICCRIKLSPILWRIVLVFLLIGVFMYPATHLQFTVTSAVIGSVSVMLLFSINWKEDSRRLCCFLFLCSALFLFLSYLQRRMTALAILPFWAAGLAYTTIKLLQTRPAAVRTILFRIGIAVLLLFASIGIVKAENSYYIQHRPDSEYFTSGFNSYRADFQDYIRPNVEYSDIADIAESVGWDEDLFNILNSLFYCDERWNFENVRDFVETYNSRFGTADQPITNLRNNASADPVGSLIMEKFLDAGRSIKYDRNLVCVFLLSGFFAILLFVTGFTNIKKYLIEILTVLCLQGGTVILITYLEFQGRMIFRSGICVLLPMLLSSMMLALSVVNDSAFRMTVMVNSSKVWYRIKGMLLMLISFCLCISVAPVFSSLTSAEGVREEKLAVERYKTIFDYAVENSDKLYVYDFSFGGDPANCSPFINYKKNPTINLLRHGGTFFNTDVNNQQIRANGKDKFVSSDYLDDNVYYLTCQPNRNMKSLLIYLDHKFGGVYGEVVDTLPGDIYVIQFKKTECIDGVTDIDGLGMLRYYDETGNLLTDKQIIDGKEKSLYSTVNMFKVFFSDEGEITFQSVDPLAIPKYFINPEGIVSSFISNAQQTYIQQTLSTE